MKPYKVQFTKEAVKDFHKLAPKPQEKLKAIFQHSIVKDPHNSKSLVDDLAGFYSHRLTYKDRMVCSVEEHARVIFVHRTRTHNGE